MGGDLVLLRLRVRVPAPYTGMTYFTIICCENCLFQKDRKLKRFFSRRNDYEICLYFSHHKDFPGRAVVVP